MDFCKFNSPAHPALMAWQREINAEATIGNVPPCALAAIVWRETGGTNEFQIGMPRTDGCGVGLTQITSGVDWSNPDDPTFQGYHVFTNPPENLYVAAAYFLHPAIINCQLLQQADEAKFARFGGGQLLYYAFASYNAGFGAVRDAYLNGVDPDTVTTDNYASDTMAKYLVLVEASRKAAA